MKMNFDYCRLDEAQMIRYAPMLVDDGTHYRSNPPREVYASLGWYKKTGTAPEAVEGCFWAENEPKDWSWDAETMTATVTYHEEEIEPIEPTPRKWSRLSIKRAAVESKLWDALKAMMVADGYWEDEFVLADYIKEDDPKFVELLAVARERFGDDVVSNFLNSLPTEA